MSKDEKILKKIYDDTISEEDVNYLVQEISTLKPGNDVDLYSLLDILGMAAFQIPKVREKHKKLVERFLYYPSHPMISNKALFVLCNYWDYIDDYLDKIKEFVKWVPWDDSEDVRHLAISLVGKYLIEKSDKELLRLLLDIFEDRSRGEEGDFIRSCAYQALGTAMGANEYELPAIDELISQLKENTLDLSIIVQAKKRLESKD